MSITVYSKPFCERCAQAKHVLRQNNITFNELVIGQDVQRDDVVEMFPGVTALPIITRDGQRVLLEELTTGPRLLNESNTE